MTNNKDLLKEMFQNVFANTDFDEAVIRRYFSTDYKQSVDGKELTFDEFLRHIRVLKEAVKTMTVRFKTIIQEDDVMFSNHVVTGETKEGRAAEVQVIAEFRFRDGKIVLCDELTHMITGDQRDRDLGSRH
jgi:ketosteroid isomerase-like protein